MCIHVPSIVHLGTVEMTIGCVQGLSGPTVSQNWARLPSFITWNPYVLTLTGGPCCSSESPVIDVKPDLCLTDFKMFG